MGQGILSQVCEGLQGLIIAHARRGLGEETTTKGSRGRVEVRSGLIGKRNDGMTNAESVVTLGSQMMLKESLVFWWEDKGSCREDGLLSFRCVEFKMSEQTVCLPSSVSSGGWSIRWS